MTNWPLSIESPSISWTDLYGGVKKVWNDITGQSTALETASQTNATNKQIADQNIQMTKEWNEYQKALQQEIFEREDTAYQRTAADMRAAGLNPLAMQGTNNAGAVVSTQAPQSNYQAQQAQTAISTLDGIMSGLSSIVGQIETIRTGKLERDQLQQQIDYQKLVNQAAARELNHKIDINHYDTDLLPEKILTHLMDWTKNGRAGQVFNFGMKDILGLLDPESKSSIPLINDLKQLVFGANDTQSLSDMIDRINENKEKSSAEKKSSNAAKKTEEKTKEYTERYSKPSVNNQKTKYQTLKEKEEEHKKRYGGK